MDPILFQTFFSRLSFKKYSLYLGTIDTTFNLLNELDKSILKKHIRSIDRNFILPHFDNAHILIQKINDYDQSYAEEIFKIIKDDLTNYYLKIEQIHVIIYYLLPLSAIFPSIVKEMLTSSLYDKITNDSYINEIKGKLDGEVDRQIIKTAAKRFNDLHRNLQSTDPKFEKFLLISEELKKYVSKYDS